MLVVGSDGMGSWAYDFIQPLLQRTFPKTTISYDSSKNPNLYIRSHFHDIEPEPLYDCPYISWSGESHRVKSKTEYTPLLEINTFKDDSIENNLYIPFLVEDMNYVKRPEIILPKKYCCAYTMGHRIAERERVFLKMRSLESTCYSFGGSCHTDDNPFYLPFSSRKQNNTAFKDFTLYIAMENKVVPGYLTEKIGNAFNSGTVPIYWGDSATVSDFFNPESYIDVSHFSSPEDAARYAIEVWRDPQKLQKFLDAPITLNSMLSDYLAIYTEYRPWQKKFVDTLRETFPDLS